MSAPTANVAVAASIPESLVNHVAKRLTGHEAPRVVGEQGVAPLRNIRKEVESLNLLATSKGAFFCASMTCAGLGIVLAPIRPSKRPVGNLVNEIMDGLGGGIVASFGFLALGHWCLPDGTPLFESTAALGLVGAVLTYHWRRQFRLAGDTELFSRANRRLITAGWCVMPVAMALVCRVRKG